MGIDVIFGLLFLVIAFVISMFKPSEKWFAVAVYLGFSFFFFASSPAWSFAPIITLFIIAVVRMIMSGQRLPERAEVMTKLSGK